MSIGRRLKEWRLEKNLKTTEIKEKTGISTGGFSDYENDKKLIGSKPLIALAENYDIDIQYILTGVRKENDISTKEKEIIEAYRNTDAGTRASVEKLLDVKTEEKSSAFKIG